MQRRILAQGIGGSAQLSRCPASAGGHAMLLEVMDAMFAPYKFHKVFYARQV